MADVAQGELVGNRRGVEKAQRRAKQVSVSGTWAWKWAQSIPACTHYCMR